MVVSVKDIGGVMRDFVPKGTEGVVVEAPWFGDPTVLFTESPRVCWRLG